MRVALDTGPLALEYCCSETVDTIRSARFLKAALVRPASRAIEIDEPCRWRLAALLLVALFSAPEVSAASVSRAQDIEAAPHKCKCGMNCRDESCCCSPGERQTERPVPAPVSERDLAHSSPCAMNPAPCGHSGVPSVPSGGPVTKMAALELLALPRFDTAGSLLALTAQRLMPLRRVSRLDRPPEHLVLA